MADFTPHIEAVARKLLGDPNPHQSTKTTLRFGTNGSLAVEIAGDKKGTWFSHEENIGGGVLDLIAREAGLKNGAAVEWLKVELGIADEQPVQRRIVSTYDYCDPAGTLLFQVVRFEPKDFRQRRLDGKGGWDWKVKGTAPVPFRLPEVIAAVAAGKRIYIPEGEKDVLALAKLGLVGTCNPGGAGKWPDTFPPHFHGADVVVLPDNDDAGRAHADLVVRSLVNVAASVRVLALPGLPHKGDVSDWLAAGGTVEKLKALADAATVASVQAEPPPLNECDDRDFGPDDAEMPAGFTDDSLALEFTKRYGATFRYVAGWGKWLKWTGTHWADETTLEVFDLARTVCREASNRAESPKIAAITAKATTIAAVERLARADRQHAATIDVWDADPWLLNTPAGVVDLRTGKMRRHRSDLHMTKITAVGPGGECPTWLAFLKRATAGDAALVAFLQRVAGYSLTGSTRDHALFFTYGTGGNGKGVFINTLVAAMGDYATTAPMETFTASTGDRHPTDLAGLRGARLVTAQETEEGRAWAESKIKSLTGGDPITARFMRQDFFTFTPQFKLLIAGNHKPGLRNVDEAMRRRFHLIPFTVTIPASERDPALPEKLKAEWPGILKWMIHGCLEWQRIGLAPPPAVVEATEEYLVAEDSFSIWMGDCLTPCARWFEPSADLFGAWKIWAERAGESPGSQKRFSQTFETKGGIPARQPHTRTRGFEGFRINRQNYAEDGRYGA